MKPDSHVLRTRVAQAVTVQESYFFRDKAPFNYFIDVMLPKLMAKREVSRRIRVWCAAAGARGGSPGQRRGRGFRAGRRAGRA
jgi:chemotaxis methyl-accepting protein methylase